MMKVFLEALRENWYLPALMALVLVLALGMYAGGGDGPQQTIRMQGDIRIEPPNNAAEPPPPQPAPQPALAPAEETQQKIDKLQAQYDEDPKAPDAPAYLNGMGNLNYQLGEYKEAARLYELLLVDFPDWDGAVRVYPQLAACYERSGDRENEKLTYARMMDKFPAESQEHLYAKAQLGL